MTSSDNVKCRKSFQLRDFYYFQRVFLSRFWQVHFGVKRMIIKDTLAASDWSTNKSKELTIDLEVYKESFNQKSANKQLISQF